MDTTQSNDLISKFLYGKNNTIHHNRYHEDWNELMYVIQNIELLGYHVNIKGISCDITKVLEKEPIVSWVLGDPTKKIQLVYITVVEFIKQYEPLPEI